MSPFLQFTTLSSTCRRLRVSGFLVLTVTNGSAECRPGVNTHLQMTPVVVEDMQHSSKNRLKQQAESCWVLSGFPPLSDPLLLPLWSRSRHIHPSGCWWCVGTCLDLLCCLTDFGSSCLFVVVFSSVQNDSRFPSGDPAGHLSFLCVCGPAHR